jgi:hypothetical protein
MRCRLECSPAFSTPGGGCCARTLRDRWGDAVPLICRKFSADVWFLGSDAVRTELRIFRAGCSRQNHSGGSATQATAVEPGPFACSRLDVFAQELPPVARRLIGGIQRRWDDRHPAVKEGLRVGRAEAIADGLQADRIGA